MNKLPIAEACLRNQAPIAENLKTLLAKSQSVLEIGSGTGQHAVFVCKSMPNLSWQSSEMPERVHEVEAWRTAENLPQLLPCKAIDVLQTDWHLEKKFDAVFTANTVHFIGPEKVEALVNGASKHLVAQGQFVIYGPFNIDKQYTSEGNRGLDIWLKQRDPESGIKDLGEFKAIATRYGFEFIKRYQMPANNFMLHFIKRV